MSDIEIKHSFVSAKADGPDTTLIRPSNWNDEHPLNLSGPGLVGRQTAGAGPAELLALASFLLPVGVVLPYGGSSAPTGFFLLDGSLKLRASYPSLFAVIGTAFNIGSGGEDGSNFRLPDMRGRVPAGVDNIGGTPAGRLNTSLNVNNTIGAYGGAQTHTLTIGELAAHDHNVTDPGHAHSTPYGGPTDPTTPSTGGGSVTSPFGAQTTSTAGTGISIGTRGNNQAHNNVQPVLVLNYIIKY